MKKAGKTVDVKIYEGAGHAFANVNNPGRLPGGRSRTFVAHDRSLAKCLKGQAGVVAASLPRAGRRAAGSCSAAELPVDHREVLELGQVGRRSRRRASCSGASR
jgi:hypothetical protein